MTAGPPLIAGTVSSTSITRSAEVMASWPIVRM